MRHTDSNGTQHKQGFDAQDITEFQSLKKHLIANGISPAGIDEMIAHIKREIADNEPKPRKKKRKPQAKTKVKPKTWF